MGCKSILYQREFRLLWVCPNRIQSQDIPISIDMDGVEKTPGKRKLMCRYKCEFWSTLGLYPSSYLLSLSGVLDDGTGAGENNSWSLG